MEIKERIIETLRNTNIIGIILEGKAEIIEIDYNGDWDSTNIASHIPSGWTGRLRTPRSHNRFHLCAAR